MVIGAHPPNYEDILKSFPKVKDIRGVVYTFGQVIFNPDNVDLPVELMYHEATHSIQQDKLGPEEWWKKYLADPKFRLKQELEAYHQQFKKYCKNQKDRNKQSSYLHKLAVDCSGEIYGKMINFSDARKWIKNGP